MRAFVALPDMKLLIGGVWRKGAGGTFPTLDPATGTVLAKTGGAQAGDAATFLEFAWAVAISTVFWRTYVNGDLTSPAALRKSGDLKLKG